MKGMTMIPVQLFTQIRNSVYKTSISASFIMLTFDTSTSLLKILKFIFLEIEEVIHSQHSVVVLYVFGCQNRTQRETATVVGVVCYSDGIGV